MEDSSFSCPSCPYCLEDLGHCEGPTTLPCGHNGCLECFTIIVNSRDPSCPLCRILLDPNVPLKQNGQFKEVLEVLARLASYVSELCLSTAPFPLLTTSDELSPSPAPCEQSRAEEECKLPLHPDSLCQACESGSTSLHQVAAEGHTNCVALLLRNGADVNAVGLFGMTALHECASHGHPACVDLLLSMGAGVDVRCPKGLTPLHCAASRGHSECVSLLLEHDGVDVDVSSQDGMTPLLYAARAGSLACMMAVLNKGGSVGAADNGLRTALHHTAHRDCVLALLTHGAKVSARAEDGSTPLLHAASLRSAGSLIALLDSGAKMDVKCKIGLAPLHVAAHHKHSECVEALLNKGAKVNVQGQDAWTALHYAVDPIYVEDSGSRLQGSSSSE